MAFDNVVFPLIVETVTSSPSFNTTIIPSGSGAEQRNANWADARSVFNASLGVRSKLDIQKLTSFFRARKGRARGFLVKDLIDCTALNDVIAVGTGSGTTFQLQRVYSDLTTKTEYGQVGNADIRPIYKPILGTVSVRSGAAGTTLLTAGGYGAFATATISGGAITAITVTNGGANYTTPPVVVISGGGGSGASASTTVSGGVVTGITGLVGGTGFTTTPTILLLNVDGNYSIDYRTGIIRLTSALPTNHILNWSGEFYVPCRFMEDALPADEIFFDVFLRDAAGTEIPRHTAAAAGGVPDVLMQETRDFI